MLILKGKIWGFGSLVLSIFLIYIAIEKLINIFIEPQHELTYLIGVFGFFGVLFFGIFLFTKTISNFRNYEQTPQNNILLNRIIKITGILAGVFGIIFLVFFIVMIIPAIGIMGT